MATSVWKNLPKIELHCHLDGSLSSTFFEKYLGRKVSSDEISVTNDCESLVEYLQKFNLPLSCLQTKEGLCEAGYDVMRQMAAEQVIYSEIRFAPLLSTQQGLSVKAVIEALLKGIARGEQEFGVTSRVIVCAMRHHSEEENLAMVKAAREFLGHGVCAADLAGAEAQYPMAGFMDLFSEVKKMEMPFTLHAGECGSARNIEDAIHAGASRIGHGIAMRGNEAVKKLALEKRVGIELCPTSNFQTKAVRSFEEYPLREFLLDGLLATINTDNRTVSNCNLSGEFALMEREVGLTYEDYRTLTENAITVAFAEDSVKHRLLSALN